MTCRRARAQLVASLVSGLPREPERIELERHLSGCAACAREKAALQRRLARMQQDVSAEAPGERTLDWDRQASLTLDRAREREFGAGSAGRVIAFDLARWRRRGWLGRPASRPWGKFAAIAAAAGLIAAAGLTVFEALLAPRESSLAVLPEAGDGSGSDTSDARTREILAAVEEFSARDRTLATLEKGREILSALSFPVACESAAAPAALLPSAGPPDTDLSRERAAARELLQSAPWIDARAEVSEAGRASDVWLDLRTVLLDLLAQNDCAPAGEAARLRASIQRSQLTQRLDTVISEFGRETSPVRRASDV